MLFNSFQFFLFFPIVTVIYFLLPYRYRWFHLLIASCVFYCAFIPVYIFILFFTIIIDYFAGLFISGAEGRKRKCWLIASLVSNIGVLAFFKYYNFFADNFNSLLHLTPLSAHSLPILGIILPIGLSFHTFQAMSYTIEVYRGNQLPEKHFGIYALYVMFYPQLVAGPIERPQHILHQLHERHDPDPAQIASGLRLMAWGYFKKMVVADHLSMYVDKVFGDPLKFGSLPSMAAIFFFTFQIYCDFSAYSDIAIGTARVMGIRLMRNFNYPYFSSSIREFWSRWHISLSTWFRDYLYIPLGGNRTGILRWCFNILVVFTLSGLWHGANWTFIIWGALHGAYMIAGRYRKSIGTKYFSSIKFAVPKFFQVVFVFLLVAFGWIFFRAKNMSEAFIIIKQCFSGLDWQHPGLISGIVGGNNFTIMLVSLILMIGIEAITVRYNAYQRFMQLNGGVRLIGYIFLCLVILIFGVFNNSRFIYFQF
jgi:D-alanyl-lipoteichoic acid acyltransferase DltB (MBOAT superfamily)